MDYQKYVYWLDPDEHLKLKKDLRDKGIREKEFKKAVCVPLARNVKAGSVLPETWGNFELCKRQLSWYRQSSHAGQILMVTDFKLDQSGIYPETIIRQSGFKPSKLPDRGKKLTMIASKEYQKAKPNVWDDIASEDPAKQDKWLKVMGLRGITFEELFITHCANHSNFIDPVYFVNGENGPVPYSIDKTKFICSACMEFYNIIGAGFRKKLVIPCPGAVIFGGLPVNRYLEVITEPFN